MNEEIYDQEAIEINIDELVDYVYDRLKADMQGLSISKDFLHLIFNMETDFMIEKGVIVFNEDELEGYFDKE
jgi:hypothetical protein